MTSIQFDECISDNKLVNDCCAEGLVKAQRFPKHLAGTGVKDPEVLKRFMAGVNPFLTSDKNLPKKHSEHIPDVNPGIIVIKNDGPFSITSTIIRSILVNFKNIFTEWHIASFNNSIIEISESKIRVSQVLSGTLMLLR